MKRYKLKKDLPTFRAGDIFELRDDGCLYLWRGYEGCKHWKTNVIAYHRKTLGKFPNILADWFEEIKDEPWKPKDRQRYYYISDTAKVCATYWIGNNINGSVEIGNCFQTKEQAEKAVEWLKAFKVLRDDTKGFKPDWKSEEQSKWTVYYDSEEGVFHVHLQPITNDSLIYFATEADAEKSIENHRKEWLTFFGVDNG